MATLAALITAAIIKVAATDPALDREGEPTAEEARDNFTALLLHELGLGPKPAASTAAAAEPAKKATKKRAPKKSTEAVVAEAAVAVLEQVKEKTPEVEALAEQLGQLALEEQPKPKKARKTKTESAPASSESESEKPKEKKKPGPKPKTVAPAPEPVVVPVVVPVIAEAAPKKKPGPKPKSKPEGPVNVDKLTPTHKKHLKSIAEELQRAIDEKGFLAYANAMSAEEWGAKSLDDHIRAFAVPAEQTEFLEVEFNGKDYLIDPATKFIYAATDGKVRDRVGVVGEKEFKDVEIDA